MLNKKNIHCIGIGGIGVSALAQIYKKSGIKVSGSDMISSKITDNLKRSGIKIQIPHNENCINKNHNLIIYSPAIPANNPELKKAKKLGISCISYPKALGELTKKYFTIAITGTHGKSTTTAMLALIFKQAKLDPTVVIGTKIKEFQNKNYRIGKSKYLIIEACEYKKSFLNLRPKILGITNIEADHLDFYKNFKNYKKAFLDFANKIPKTGKIILNKQDKTSLQTIKNTKAQIIKTKSEKIKLNILGKFNLENALLATTIAKELNISEKDIKKALKNFKGTWRRMDKKKIKGYKCKFIDDYAHHPTEIKATLKALKDIKPTPKILCIFQPHQYNRTKVLLKEFGKSFKNADKVIIPNIYKVRDKKNDIKEVSSEILAKEINKNSSKNKAIDGRGVPETAKYIKQNHKKFDIIITMGAGDIDMIYKYL